METAALLHMLLPHIFDQKSPNKYETTTPKPPTTNHNPQTCEQNSSLLIIVGTNTQRWLVINKSPRIPLQHMQRHALSLPHMNKTTAMHLQHHCNISCIINTTATYHHHLLCPFVTCCRCSCASFPRVQAPDL